MFIIAFYKDRGHGVVVRVIGIVAIPRLDLPGPRLIILEAYTHVIIKLLCLYYYIAFIGGIIYFFYTTRIIIFISFYFWLSNFTVVILNAVNHNNVPYTAAGNKNLPYIAAGCIFAPRL